MLINMINIADKNKAEILKNQGFKYRVQNIDKKEIFIFMETPELRKLLNEKFSDQDFFISKTMNF